jgi:hypothetical protein
MFMLILENLRASRELNSWLKCLESAFGCACKTVDFVSVAESFFFLDLHNETGTTVQSDAHYALMSRCRTSKHS